MGVPGLWKEIQAHGTDTALARLGEICESSSSSSSSTKSQRKTLRLGIDVSSWLYHANKSVGGYNSQLRLLFYRLCRLLAVPYVLPIFVFDGPHRPKEKRGIVRRNYQEASMIEDLKDLIVAFGFVVYDALGEAEAELASLNALGAIDAVMSDDVDSFVFGARIVVRNWGQDLSGSKARNDFVAKLSASDESPDLSGEEIPSNSQTLSAKDRQALGTNLITYFDANNLEREGLSLGGLILVAILSGGDYDVQGLPRCGVKISTALAKAGLGDALLKGVKKHCKPPALPSEQIPTRGMTAPEPLLTWSSFLSEWIASVRHELSTNKSGHLGRRFKKLAESNEFADLLSTKASLCVLGSYVWPVTTKEAPVFVFGEVDLAKIANICQISFRWTAPSTLDTMRNNLWEGCVVRELLGERFCNAENANSVKNSANKSKSKSKPADDANLSNFFTSKVGDVNRQVVAEEGEGGAIGDSGSPLQSIASHRESGSTGYVKEIRAICNVQKYVELAKSGLNFNLTIVDLRGEQDLPPPSQEAPLASPRKRKPFEDPSKDLRLWISSEVIESNLAAQLELKRYQEKMQLKSKSKDIPKKKQPNGQIRLDNFFLSSKAESTSTKYLQKQFSTSSPSKKRSPPLSSSQSMNSSSFESNSPSVLTSATKMKSLAIPTKVAKRVSPKIFRAKEVVIKEARPTEWNTSILDYPEEEAIRAQRGDSSLGDFSLPEIRLPQRSTISHPADESVEFVGLQMSTSQPAKTQFPDQAIEVSDESDEEA